MEQVAIIADPEGEGYYFAKGIYNYLKTKEGDDFCVDLIEVNITNFRDGEFKVKIKENLRRKKCFLVLDSNKEPCRWFTELAFKLDAMRFSSPAEVNLVLPYVRFARQDRKDESRVGVSSKVLAKMISLYATRVLSVDLHVPQIQEYFDIPLDNLYSFPSLVNYIKKKHPEMLNNLVIVSPDLGGGKRAESLVKRLSSIRIQAEVAFGHKTREKENEVAKSIIIGNVDGKNCLIVDDIIDTGNTLVKTAEKLKEKNAKKIFAYATHGLFSEGTEKFSVFDKILVSDTLNLLTQKPRNFETVSLINLFGEAIYRTVIGESLSVLFDANINNIQSSLGFYEKI
jgi:ribose-phosphate pyrophosphokinase